jgi:hypothetical protein
MASSNLALARTQNQWFVGAISDVITATTFAYTGGVGGVAERSNAAVSKTVSGLWVRRGFKSLPLRFSLASKLRRHASGS